MPARPASSSRSTNPEPTAACSSAARSSGSAWRRACRRRTRPARAWPSGPGRRQPRPPAATRRSSRLGRQLLAAGRCWPSAIGSCMAAGFRRSSADRRRGAGQACRAGAARAAAPAAQPGADPRRRPGGAAHAAGRLLRYGFPPQPASVGAGLRPAARITAAGVRRYGFHGLSYDYIVTRLRETEPELAAAPGDRPSRQRRQPVRATRRPSVASTMGFTALDGLMMGTRCGSLDPGVLLYLMQERGLDAEAIEDLLYDGPACSASPASPPTCAPCASPRRPRRPKRSPCSSTASCARSARWRPRLGGLDGLVFTAGIGENDAATALRSPPAAAGSAWNSMTRQPVGEGPISAAGAGHRLGPADRRGTHDRPLHQPDAGPLIAVKGRRPGRC